MSTDDAREVTAHRYARLDRATGSRAAPLAVVDLDAFDRNADALVARAGGAPIRLATKSVRCRHLIARALARPGFQGLLAFSLREALWLAGTQIGGDILVAYPCVDAAAVGELAGDDRARERIALVVDAPEQLALIGSAVRAVAPARRGPVRVWLDIDCSLRVGPAHLGARRSPLHTVSEVVRAARAVGRSVKPVGSGHSFSPVALTDGVLVDLSGMCGLAGVDRNVARASALGLPAALGESVSLVRVRAGTRLRHLNQMLAEQGLAMPNLGDIDAQTISGALATGTHGTGARFPGLAACVTAVQLVLADASIVECSRHVRPELFAAARLGIGAIGIVTEVELACVPAFLVRAQERPERLDAVLERLPAWGADTDHVDLYVFPHTDRALVKRNTRLGPGEDGPRLADWRRRLDDDLLSNTVLERVCRLGSRSPARVPALNEVAGRALSARTFVAPSHEVFVTRRDVRFRECEWAVPAASLVPLLTGLREYFARRDPVVGMPVEVRFGAADDVWLSPGFGRDTGYLAVHEHHSAPPSSYFADVEAMVREHAGRPHWGKLHGLGADRLRELYPRFDDFVAVRDAVDPQRLFGNEYLTRVLGD